MSNNSIQNHVGYDRSALDTGIVHIGVGGFHRSHQAWYVDELLRQSKGDGWAICGVGVMPGDKAMRDALRQEDMSYVLLSRAADGTEEVTRIGSITEYLWAPENPQAVIEKIADPGTKLLTLTITEGGYNVDDVTGQFNFAEPAVAHDLTGEEAPKTAFGLVAAGLKLRSDNQAGPITILSCDNIQHNGKVAEVAFTEYAKARYPELGEWIADNVTFPSSMVDRITPATKPEDIEYLRSHYGIETAWPVVAEDFAQWVIEDDFVAGRPQFELVGAQMVSDVAPYEKLKLRFLNASHQALAYFGHLRGYEFAHDAVRDETIRALVTEYMLDEAINTLDPVPGIDVREYSAKLLERFGNEAIADTLERLATDGSDRIAKFVLPVQRDLLRRGQRSPRTSGIVAAWALVNELTRTGERPALAKDRQYEEITRLFTEADGNPELMIRSETIFGDLAESEEFAGRVAQQYHQLVAARSGTVKPSTNAAEVAARSATSI